MIPKFDSTADMLGFLRALPSNANYEKMLKDDFDIDAPADAPLWQKEYLWKFGVQGIKNGLTGEELIKYAADSTTNFVAKNPFMLKSERFVTDANTVPTIKTSKPARAPRVPGSVQVSGGRHAKVQAVLTPDMPCVILWDTKRNKYSGYLGGIFVSCGDTPDKVMKNVTKNYGVTKTEVTLKGTV